MPLLEGKKGLILNIANDRSIATHIATNCVKHGATCGFGFLPMENREKSERRVRKAMEENGFAEAWLHPCDVGSDESINTFLPFPPMIRSGMLATEVPVTIAVSFPPCR